jgi:Kef-type K+ transport system membrane component KefB
MRTAALARRATVLTTLPSDARKLSKERKRVALAIAAAADLAQVFLLPLFGEGGLSPLDDALDLVVAVALVSLVGFRWRTVLAFALELVPGVALFPSWTAMVASLPATEDDPSR